MPTAERRRMGAIGNVDDGTVDVPAHFGTVCETVAIPDNETG